MVTLIILGIEVVFFAFMTALFEYHWHKHGIPAKTIHGTGRPNPQYDVELQRMRRDLATNKGVMIYFSTVPERWFLPAESELKERLPLTVSVAPVDGSIYRVNSEAKEPASRP